MEKNKSQFYLYQLVQIIKKEARDIKLESKHFLYFKFFIKKNKKLFKRFIYLLFLQIALEIFIPLFVNFQLNRLNLMLERQLLLLMLIFLLLIISFYLVVSFFCIQKEKKILIYIINDLRKKWFNIYLNKNDNNIREDKKSGFIAKMTYHFPLLQIGLNNSGLNIIKWLFFTLALIILSFLTSTKLLILVILAIPLNLLIIFIGYIIAKAYVSRETTLYSEIIKHITKSLYNLSFIKKNKLEKKANEKLNNIVNLDTHFRIKRQLWIIFGNKIIFALLFLMLGLVYLLQIYYPAFIFTIPREQIVIYSLTIIYLSRLLYISLKIGLFLYPLKLGTFLSIPLKHKEKSDKEYLKNFNKLEINSPKAKLFNNGQYFKNINIKFNKPSRNLIYGDNFIGKTSLGLILAGENNFNSKAWIVKIDNKRKTHNEYLNNPPNTYFINPNFYSENTLLEVIAGNYKEYLNTDEINNLISKISKNPEFSYLLNLKNNLNTNFNKLKFSPSQSFIIQSAYCIINKPDIVIIDNLWLDLNYTKIKNIINILDKKLNDSIIICLATKNNDLIKYDKRYNFSEKTIKEI